MRASAIEVNGALQLEDSGGIITLGHGIIEVLESSVVVSYVSLVVLLVMQLHSLRINNRLQIPIVVWEIRQSGRL